MRRRMAQSVSPHGVRGAALIVAGTASVALAGCVSVLPDAGPAPDVYRLGMASQSADVRVAQASNGAEHRATPMGWVVMVPTPLAPRALNTDRIAVSMSRGRVSYAAAARWDEPAPRLVQEAVIVRLEADPRIRAAVRPEDGVQGAYELRLDLRRFEAVYAHGDAAAPTVEVRMRARLIHRDNRELAATTQFSASARASENRVSAITAAFDRALGEVTGQLVTWTVDASDDAHDSEGAVEAGPDRGPETGPEAALETASAS